MEPGVKMIAGGLVLFVLGGLSVYLISRPAATTPAQIASQEQSAYTPATTATSASSPEPATDTIDAESFYEEAEARREQQLIDKAEADRLAKLKAAKERSVECKFWKQQQKTSSAAAKIDEKINEHCNLPSSSSASTSSLANDSSSTTQSSAISAAAPL
jgi:hypothetical protein